MNVRQVYKPKKEYLIDLIAKVQPQKSFENPI